MNNKDEMIENDGNEIDWDEVIRDWTRTAQSNIKEHPSPRKPKAPKNEGKPVSEPRSRIAKCPTPASITSFDEWRQTIETNFPDLLPAAESALSIVTQFLIKDITNPFALVFVDVPSSGKTIAINFFDKIPELTYPTDKFTPASFVSNAANVKKKDLADVDLLPRIQYRMFLIRDFATLFSKRDDDLNELLGTLTRVLDGEGLNTDSGVHGQRQYVGEYLFMMLGASTPIPPKVWKLMGNLGSRLFFLGTNSRDKSDQELVEQVSGMSFKAKEVVCQEATRNLLYTLWNAYPDGIEWDKNADNKEILATIVRCSKLLANLRGVINVWRDEFENTYTYQAPVIERPDRINQLLTNFARGHAIACGRTQISLDDLRPIIAVILDSAQYTRSKLFKALIARRGAMRTTDVESELKLTKPTALARMKELELLGVCDLTELGEHEITLRPEFEWFVSDEFRLLRGEIPIKQIELKKLLGC